MYVATNRQKAPENGFEKRARLKREADEARAEVRAAKAEAAPAPDLEAMKAAAAEAAALIAPGPVTLKSLIDSAPEPHNSSDEPIPAPEGAAKRGRPQSAAVRERDNKILVLLGENPEGLSKPQLAEALNEKEPNVYTSLRRLQSDGKVRNENTDGTRYLWYLA